VQLVPLRDGHGERAGERRGVGGGGVAGRADRVHRGQIRVGRVVLHAGGDERHRGGHPAGVRAQEGPEQRAAHARARRGVMRGVANYTSIRELATVYVFCQKEAKK
jgi:hypothetical protein